MLERGGGSRGSHCVLDDAGTPMHPRLRDAAGKPLRMKPENVELRSTIQHLRLDENREDSFAIRWAPPRPMPERAIAFEPAWTEFREGRVFTEAAE
jgi:hypothetical protein